MLNNGRNFFDHPVKNDTRTYENIREIAKEMIRQLAVY